jgi:hypothetical protein
MVATNSLAYYDTEIITVVISFIVEARPSSFSAFFNDEANKVKANIAP